MAQANTALPKSVFTGQKAQLRLISKSHGAITPTEGQDLTITPKGSAKVVGQYGSQLPSLIYYVYENVTGKMSYTRDNQKQIAAVLMDQNPAQATMAVLPTLLQPFHILQNLKGGDGLIKSSTLTLGCQPVPSAFTGKLMDAASGSLDFTGLGHYEFEGLALQYVRATAGTAAVGRPAVPTLAVVATGGTLGIGRYFVRITAITATGESMGSEEAFIDITSATTNKITVTTPAPAGTITGYRVYLSQLSGGEADTGVSGDGSATPLAATALPASSATPCPNLDTTGTFAAAGDLKFAGSGPYTVTLPKAAVINPVNGLMYVAVFFNGALVGNSEEPALTQDWAISTDGTTFSLRTAPAAGDVWDIFTIYQP